MAPARRLRRALARSLLYPFAAILLGCGDTATKPSDMVSIEVQVGLTAPEPTAVQVALGWWSTYSVAMELLEPFWVQPDGRVRSYTFQAEDYVRRQPLAIRFGEPVALPRGYSGPLYQMPGDRTALCFDLAPSPEVLVLLAAKAATGWTVVTGLNLPSVLPDSASSREFWELTAARFVEEGNAAAAMQAYAAVAWYASTDAERDAATARLGQLLFESAERCWERGRYEEAIGMYQQLTAECPDCDLGGRSRQSVPQLLYSAGLELAESGSVDEAIRLLERIVAEYPADPRAGSAAGRLPGLLYAAGAQAEADSSYQEAISWYERIVDDYPDSPNAELAEWGIFFCQLELSAAGELPPAEGYYVPHLGDPQYCARNDTQYHMTVQLRGPGSATIRLAPQAEQCATLPPGSYRVAVTVNAPNVGSYLGSQELKTNYYYPYYFYIVTQSRKAAVWLGLRSGSLPEGNRE